ncbi:hypothetical protein, conserved [Plasmodium gonderi]|uniref:Uncharacterized protein n=1 Tax=Plasmodium gonderi TaxID=77519 RepID=A0A1Y1JSF1_PLAGO|nr:hypothetical protein, conserved [Plasmodium gonderi]GAW82884.1 hypothetical protein, conserved [Plasmodium gonderi]
MGNISCAQQKKPLTMLELSTKIGEYRTINEGDPEMIEDPDFPQKMMNEALSNNTTIDGNAVQGTFVYYPNKMKPKMWIGNYRILNPEDILCTDVAEKIGFSESEWKNYMKARKREQDEPNNVEIVPSFDSAQGVHSMTLKETKKRGNIDPCYGENGEDLESYGRTQFINDPFRSNGKYEGKNGHDNDQHPHSNSCIVEDNEFDEDIYYDMNSTREEESGLMDEVEGVEIVENMRVLNKRDIYNKHKHANQLREGKHDELRRGYIEKLNNEIATINAQQEKIINEKRNDLFMYSKSNRSKLVVPENNGSLLMQNVNRSKKGEKNNIIAELISENNKKFSSKIYSLNKKKKEGYANLSSMSTKGSLQMKTSSKDKDSTLNRTVYLNRTLVK